MKPATAQLDRALGTWDCALLVIGNMIGTGVFLTTGNVAGALPGGGWILLAWLAGGVFALTGALTYAEMGALFPQAGGHYVYIRETYGRFCGFLDGWIAAVAAFPCCIAFIAMGFARYLSYFYPWCSSDNMLLQAGGFTIHGGHVPALGAVALLTLLNSVGLRLGRDAQNLLTGLKLAALLGMTAVGLLSAGGNTSQVFHWPALPASAWTGFGTALIGVSFAYLGWDAATYVAGECRTPQRTLPRALAAGTLVVTIAYLLFNIALLRLVPVTKMPQLPNVSQEAATITFGTAGNTVLSAAIVLCILGAMNATIICGPRVLYAMAEDAVFFRRFARVHPRFHVPSTAIVAQGIWTGLIILTGSYGSILTAAVSAMLVSSLATAAAIFVLRARRPDMARPYRTWGYPWVPLIFCAGTAGILLNALRGNPTGILWSIGLLTAGVPVYLYARHTARS